MAAPDTVIVHRYKPPVSLGRSGDRQVRIAEPPREIGDPFKFAYRPTQDSRYYLTGNVRPHPGVHLNLYTAIPHLQAIAEKSWGRIRRIIRSPQIAAPRGLQQSVSRGVADINLPERTTFAAFVTHSGDDRERLRNGYDHLIRSV